MNVGIKLKAMLEINATLQCFEIEVKNLLVTYKPSFVVPIKFMSLMANGLKCNTNIQQLRIPFAMSSHENDIQTFLCDIFDMKHLKELQLNFYPAVGLTPTLRITSMEVLFYEHALPTFIKMLQLKKPIRSLSIQCLISNEDYIREWKKTVEQFYEAIFLHPTLDYVEVISDSTALEPIFKTQQKALIAKHKEKQPIPKVVHIRKNFMDGAMKSTQSLYKPNFYETPKEILNRFMIKVV